MGVATMPAIREFRYRVSISDASRLILVLTLVGGLLLLLAADAGPLGGRSLGRVRLSAIGSTSGGGGGSGGGEPAVLVANLADALAHAAGAGGAKVLGDTVKVEGAGTRDVLENGEHELHLRFGAGVARGGVAGGGVLLGRHRDGLF